MSATRLLCCLSVAIGPAACTTLPELPDEPRVTVDDIIVNVECEVFNAVSWVQAEYAKSGKDVEEHWLSEWAATVNFHLQSEVTSDATPTLTIAAPLNPGTLTFSFGGNRKDENEALGKFDYAFNLAALEGCNPPTSRSLLAGDVGVEDWLKRVARAMDATDNVPRSMSHDSEFIISIGGNGGLILTDVPAGDGLVGGGPAASGLRKDTHRLTVALAPIPPAELAKIQGPALVGRRVEKQVGPQTERRLDEELDELRVERLEETLDDAVDDVEDECDAAAILCFR